VVRGGWSATATCALGDPRDVCEGDIVYVSLVSLSMPSSSSGGGSMVVVGFVASGGWSRESSSTSLRLPWL
jgi:hypothetical protein